MTDAETPTTAAGYGSWPSPLTADVLAAGGVRLAGLASLGEQVWWSELRPAEAGRSVIVRKAGPAESAADALDAPWSARTRVHEYGGGAWWLGGDSLFFADWSDQRLYRMSGPGTEPTPITPEIAQSDVPLGVRYADGRHHPTEPWLVCVRERHTGDREPVNELVAIPVDDASAESGQPHPTILGSGPDGQAQADFVSSPRFSPDGRWLSWIRWDHPLMPWDGTELCVAPVFGGMRLGNVQVVAGNDHESITSADWTADGRLVYAADRTGYWNLYSMTPGSAGDRSLTDLVGEEIGGPQWEFGLQRWAELPDGRLAVVVTRDAVDRLAIVDAGTVTTLDDRFVAIDELVATERDTIIITGATAHGLAQIVELDLDGTVVAVHREPDDVGIDPTWFSVARSIRYRSGSADAEREVQAFVYMPMRHGDGETPPDGERPPLVVMGHGGPTSHASPALNLRIQYWTSRGFAVADVNYGGSSGFGRAYRRLLDDAWGIVDVEDCIGIARHLAGEGLVDPARMAIRGGSAGGFTVLAALTTSDVFSAGTSLYGVADLEALATDTHKFESRYLDGLIGPYPARRDVYEERSPIHHTDELSCPLLVLQGLEDEIVPPNQAEAIVGALAAKGIPHAYVPFAGEQHGFRQEANIIRSYEVELWFYGRVFGFEPADTIIAPEGAVGL